MACSPYCADEQHCCRALEVHARAVDHGRAGQPPSPPAPRARRRRRMPRPIAPGPLLRRLGCAQRYQLSSESGWLDLQVEGTIAEVEDEHRPGVSEAALDDDRIAGSLDPLLRGRVVQHAVEPPQRQQLGVRGEDRAVRLDRPRPTGRGSPIRTSPGRPDRRPARTTRLRENSSARPFANRLDERRIRVVDEVRERACLAVLLTHEQQSA